MEGKDEKRKRLRVRKLRGWSFCLSIATSEVFGDDVLDSAPQIGGREKRGN